MLELCRSGRRAEVKHLLGLSQMLLSLSVCKRRGLVGEIAVLQDLLPFLTLAVCSIEQDCFSPWPHTIDKAQIICQNETGPFMSRHPS